VACPLLRVRAPDAATAASEKHRIFSTFRRLIYRWMTRYMGEEAVQLFLELSASQACQDTYGWRSCAQQ